MSPAHVLEPTYDAIKRRLTDGRWPAGFRLDTARLANDLGVSKSPVRDSLNRLAGERMIDFAPGDGFHVGAIDEQRLRDLLDLNMYLLLAAAYRELLIPDFGALPTVDHAKRTATCFNRLASASGNHELVLAVANLNDRLSVSRQVEVVVLRKPSVYLDALEHALSSGAPPRRIRTLLVRYHVERRLVAAKIAYHLARGDRSDDVVGSV